MKNYQRFYLMLFMLSLSMVTFAQQKTITGRVTDTSNETLPGVSVVVKGTTTGTVTNIDGIFQLTMPGDASTVIFSSIGFNSKEVVISGLATVDVQLSPSVINMNEVVVVGYGTLKKSDLTGAVSKVSASQLQGPSTTDAVATLQGKVAGVSITPSSGEPGAAMKIQVRGTGSWANTQPLYVVDGFQVGDLSSVDPSNISSVEVLKDASATAIYGSRGANGVVLVTTKKGSAGATVYEATVYGGVQYASKQLDMCTASQYAMLREEAYANDGTAPSKEEKEMLDYAKSTNMKGTNWQDEIFQVAPIQNYSFAARGGNEVNKFNVGFTYFDQQGIVKNSGMKKLYAYVNNSYQLSKKITLDANISYSTYKKMDHNTNAWTGTLPVALQMDPLTPAWDSFTNNYGNRWASGLSLGNPAQTVDAQKNQTKSDQRFITNFTLNINDILIKGLSFRTMGAAQMVFSNEKYYLPQYYIDVDQRNDLSSLQKKNSQQTNLSWNGFFNYVKDINDNSINATIGSEIQQFESDNTDATRYNIPSSSDLMYFNQSQEPVKFNLIDGAGLDRLESFFARANYSYKSKYLLTATIRADGNSKFSADNQWGYFPSFSAGWNVKEEGFMENVDLINRLKVRAGWGEVGNANAVSSWSYLSLMKSDYNYSFGGLPVQGSKAAVISNPNLKWEVSSQINGGVDLTLIDQKLDVTLDYFVRDTKDMQISKPIPEYVGAGRPMVNAASMRNKGFEFSMNWNDNVGAVNYTIGFNGSMIKNEITDMAGGTAIEAGSVGNFPYNACRTDVGNEVGYFYGLKTDGLFRSQDQLDALNYTVTNADGSTTTKSVQPGAKLGDVKFIDQNGDNVIDGNDRVKLGSAQPDFTCGINGNLDYKGVDFRFALVGVFGNEIVNGMNKQIMASTIWSNWSTDKLNRWSIDNPNGTEPRLTVNDANNNSNFSDRYIEDGSFVALRNVQLGYSFNKTILSKLKLSKLRLYVSADNLLRWTKYSGYTPEVGDVYGSPIAPGIDYATYPTPVILTGGINVNF